MTQPARLEHGERFAKLTVLELVNTNQGWKYRVGCVCGYSGMKVRANALLRGRVKSCVKCRESSCAR